MATVVPSYAAIIDAGSTSSRLFIYQWHTDLALGEPLSVRTVFPSNSAEKKNSECAGGIQHHQHDMSSYLAPALQAGRAFLQARNVTNVPLYLLATGGMREQVPAAGQAHILQEAHRAMGGLSPTFSVGAAWQTSARVIPGSVEGLYGWVALNYGRSVEEQISGLLELGGASMQIAYKVPNTQRSKERVCLLSGEHRVYSETWDGFGADSANRRIQLGLLAAAGGGDGTGFVANPCLPRGQVGTQILGSNRTSIGTGDFATCLVLAKAQLVDGLKTRDVIPSYLDIASFSKHFFGVSNYWYNYQFFAKWGAYDVRRAYDRKAFTAAVTEYCSSDWAAIPWVEGDKDRTSPYTIDRCIYAAWMLTLLHDDQYGFGLEMTQYDTWKGLFRFPTTPDLASRSSWTIGAAALIARHGELSLCPNEDSQPGVKDAPDFSVYTSPVADQVQSQSVLDLAAHITPTPSSSLVTNLGLAQPPFLFMCALTLALFGVIGCQRHRLARISYAVKYQQEKEDASAMIRTDGSV